MLAVFYIIISILFGILLVKNCINTENVYQSIGGRSSLRRVPYSLFEVPAGIIVGVMVVTFIHYYLTLLLVKMKTEVGVAYVIATTLICIVFLSASVWMIYKLKNRKCLVKKYYHSKKRTLFYSLTILGIVVIVTFLMFYSYRIEDNTLLAGPTVFSDLSPHTAMVSSFGVGGNVPTSYMHFSGDGIRWHFFFYFYAGILNYLGAPIDVALNIPTILTMSSTLVLLGTLAVLLTRKITSFLLTNILIFWRSAFNIFYIISGMKGSFTSILEAIFKNSKWSETTPYDGWGIWSINVYPNQRHLMLGIGAVTILIMLFAPYVKQMIYLLKNKKIKEKFKSFILSKEAWISKKEDNRMIIALLITVMLPYFHGSALVAGLLILFGMAIFSTNRLKYLILAILAVISSMIQTRILSGGASNVIGIEFEWGFVSKSKDVLGVLQYICTITGITLLLSFIYCFLPRKRKLNKILLGCFLLPFLFVFFVKITKEAIAGHKFIMISLCFINIFVSGLLIELLTPIKNKKLQYKYANLSKMFLGIVFLLMLTATGIYEWSTFYNKNKKSVSMKMDTEMVKWIKENTEKDDVFLTPNWAFNRFFLAGRPTFYGWSYYAWSAGHDTDQRLEDFKFLLSGADGSKKEFVEFCKKNNIKYVVDDDEMQDVQDDDTGEYLYNRKFVTKNFKLVFEDETDAVRIYQIY